MTLCILHREALRHVLLHRDNYSLWLFHSRYGHLEKHSGAANANAHPAADITLLLLRLTYKLPYNCHVLT